jgi:hypothetical protein
MGSLRRIALVALFAIVSSAVLPLAHGGTSHATECGVCVAISHGGARVADVAPLPSLPALRACPAVDAVVAAPISPRPVLAVHGARAPPVALAAA